MDDEIDGVQAAGEEQLDRTMPSGSVVRLSYPSSPSNWPMAQRGTFVSQPSLR